MKDQARGLAARLVVLVVLIAVLTACGNNDEYGVLPTRIQLPVDTPTPVADTPSSTTPPPVSASPTTTPEVAPSEVTSFVAEASAVPVDSTPIFPVEVDKDYSALTAGQVVMLYGELTVETDDEGDNPFALIVDEAGNKLEVLLPLGVVETLLGHPISIAGVVVSSESSTSGLLGIRPSVIDRHDSDSPDELGTTTPSSDFDSSRLPTADAGTLEALLAPIPGAERALTAQISPDLSPFQIYDELMSLIGSDIEDLFWVALRGGTETDTYLEFLDEETELITIFRVDADGGIYMSTTLSLPPFTYYPIRRTDINTDIAELVDKDPLVSSTEEAFTYLLKATGEETAKWTVFRGGVTVAIYDAIIPPE